MVSRLTSPSLHHHRGGEGLGSRLSAPTAGIEALRREAFRRAPAAGYGKPDASKVLRELLDAWMKASRGKP